MSLPNTPAQDAQRSDTLLEFGTGDPLSLDRRSEIPLTLRHCSGAERSRRRVRYRNASWSRSAVTPTTVSWRDQ